MNTGEEMYVSNTAWLKLNYQNFLTPLHGDLIKTMFTQIKYRSGNQIRYKKIAIYSTHI